MANAQKTMAMLDALPLKEYSFPDYGLKFNFFTNAQKSKGTQDFPNYYQYSEYDSNNKLIFRATCMLSRKWFYRADSNFLNYFKKEITKFNEDEIRGNIIVSHNYSDGSITFEGWGSEYKRTSVCYTTNNYRFIVDIISTSLVSPDFYKKFLPKQDNKISNIYRKAGKSNAKITLPQCMELDIFLNFSRFPRGGNWLSHPFNPNYSNDLLFLLDDYSQKDNLVSDENFELGFKTAAALRDALYKEYSADSSNINLYIFEPDKKLMPRASEFYGIAFSKPNPKNSGNINTLPLLGVHMLNETEISVDEAFYKKKIVGVKLKNTYSAAYMAGIRKDDIIQKIDNKEILKSSDVASYLGTKKAGDQLTIQLLRNDKTQTVKVNLANRNRVSVENYIFRIGDKVFLAEIEDSLDSGLLIEKMKKTFFQALNSIE
jgi:hypothetical protein